MPAPTGSRADDAGRGGWVCVARLAGAHGVKGEVRVETLTEGPATVAAFATLHAGPGGPPLKLVDARAHKGGLIARIGGVGDRDAAAALAGTRLYVPRNALLALAGERYYHADLIGMAAVDADGTALGVVSAVMNYGAGDLLEIAAAGGGTALVPLTREAVPVVDLDGGRIIIDPAFVA